MDAWYYKTFDSDFGPITFDELVDLVKNQRLSREDVVRFGENGQWRRAGSIGALMAHFPFEAPKKVVALTTQKPASEGWDSSGSNLQPKNESFTTREPLISASLSLAESNPSNGIKKDSNSSPDIPVREISEPHGSVADQIAKIESRWWSMIRGRGWRCMIRGMEYGPLDLPQLIDWASKGFLSRMDYVRLGMEPYVLADEFPELFSQLPGQKLEKIRSEINPRTDILPVPLSSPFQNGVISSHTFYAQPAADQPAIPVGKLYAEQSSGGIGESLTSPVAAGVESRWWCKIRGKEYGPIDLPKLIDWASTGRLGRKDYVRLGTEPYVLADEFAELFPMLPGQKLDEIRSEIDTQADTRLVSSNATSLNSGIGFPKPAAIESPQSVHAEPIGSQEPASIVSRPEPRPASISSPSQKPANISHSFQVPPATSRPTVPATKHVPKQGTEGIIALVTSPITMLIGGVLVVGALIYFAIPADQTANVTRVKQMETLLEQVAKLRSNSSVNSAEAKTVSEELGKTAKSISEELKDTRDKKTMKVLTLAKNLEKLSEQDLSKPSGKEKKTDTGKEKKFDTALSAAKSALVSAKRALGMQ